MLFSVFQTEESAQQKPESLLDLCTKHSFQRRGKLSACSVCGCWLAFMCLHAEKRWLWRRALCCCRMMMIMMMMMVREPRDQLSEKVKTMPCLCSLSQTAASNYLYKRNQNIVCNFMTQFIIHAPLKLRCPNSFTSRRDQHDDNKMIDWIIFRPTIIWLRQTVNKK